MEKNSLSNAKPFQFPFKTQNVTTPNNLTLTYAYTLPNGDKVYTSPAYNMPVIKPGMSPFKTLPNIGSD